MKAKILVRSCALVNLVDLVDYMAKSTGKPLSKSEIRRRIKDGAVYINNERKVDYTEDIPCGDNYVVVKWGKRGNYGVLSPADWEEKEIEITRINENGDLVCTAETLVTALCSQD